jgi:hypothetical protein
VKARRTIVPSSGPLLASAAAVTTFLLAGPARAQGSYRSLPLGGRSALLGNTGVAFAEDNAAAFLNPATLASAPGTRVAVSVNFFRFATLSLGSWYNPGAIDPSRYPGLELPDGGLSKAGFTALPSSLCVGTQLGKSPPPPKPGQPEALDRAVRLSFCYATREQTRLDFTAQARSVTSGQWTDDRIQTIATSFNRFDIGPTMAVALDEQWSIGASLLATVTNLDQTLATSAATYDNVNRGVVTGIDVFRDSSSIDASLLLGVRWKPSPEMTFGLGFTTPTLHILGSYAGTAETRILVPGSAADNLKYEKGSFVSSTPLRLSLGAGFRRKRTRVEADVFFAAPDGAQARASGDTRTTTYTNGTITEGNSTFERTLAANAVVNAAVGVEHFLNPNFSILSGFSTDFSPVALGGSVRPSLDQISYTKRSRAALSIGIGSYGPGGDLLLGADVAYQWGITAAPNPYASPPGLDWVNISGIQVMLVLSGSTNITTLKRVASQMGTFVTGGEPAVKTPEAPPKPAAPETPHN